MRKSTFSEEQVMGFLEQAAAAMPPRDGAAALSRAGPGFTSCGTRLSTMPRSAGSPPSPAVPSTDAPVTLEPYDAGWPVLFGREADLLEPVLRPWLAGAIEHIGSTAVPGLWAKPVIDIMAPVSSLVHAAPAIEALSAIGYGHFPYKAEVMLWFCKPSPAHRTHHLHLVPRNSPLWVQRLAFRDALRSSAALAAEYQALKRRLAIEHAHDREAYTESKSPFILLVLARAGAEEV